MSNKKNNTTQTASIETVNTIADKAVARNKVFTELDLITAEILSGYDNAVKLIREHPEYFADKKAVRFINKKAEIAKTYKENKRYFAAFDIKEAKAKATETKAKKALAKAIEDVKKYEAKATATKAKIAELV